MIAYDQEINILDPSINEGSNINLKNTVPFYSVICNENMIPSFTFRSSL